MAAAKEGKEALVIEYSSQDGDVNERSSNGNTALLWAAFNTDLDLVEVLLDRRAQVNATNNIRQFPLCMAAHKGRKDIVEKLLEAGADKKMKFQSNTAAEWAEKGGSKDLAEFIRGWSVDINRFETVTEPTAAEDFFKGLFD